MSYRIEQHGEEHWVIDEYTEECLGRHGSDIEALAHMANLLARQVGEAAQALQEG